jgi:hypothetical protein
MNKTINIDGVEYNLVPVPSTQEVTKEKTQTKYRKNGALVFAPKYNEECFSVDKENFDVYDETFSSEENFNLNFPVSLLQQSLVFDNKEACQIWADKLKTAYALKQEIVESESEDDYLEYAYVFWNEEKKSKDYDYQAVYENFSYLRVSTNAKDILMSDDVPDAHFQSFIEVFSN